MVRHEQVHGQDRVNLDEYSILRAPDKAFNMQVLFDFSEKYFDFPALFVTVRNGFCRQAKMIGQKLVTLPGVGVPVAYSAQAQSFSPAVLHFNNMVSGNAGFAIDGTALHQLKYGVFLEACIRDSSWEESVVCGSRPKSLCVTMCLAKTLYHLLQRFWTFFIDH